MSRLFMQSGSFTQPLTHAAAAAALMLGVGLFGIHASFAPSLMSRAENSGERVALEAARAVAIVECDEMRGNAARVCTAQVSAEDRFQKAELESRYRGTDASALNARSARSAADRDIANAKCGDLRGDRTACLLAARPLRGAVINPGGTGT
jgi:hypothetical protein